MTPLHLLEVLVGLCVVGVALSDLFQSIVVPRPAVGGPRLTGYLIRGGWWAWRALWTRSSSVRRRENRLGSYGPLAVLILLFTWVSVLAFGYGLMLDAIGDQIRPRPDSLGTSLYFSGVSLLTLGFGDFVPVGRAARAIVLAEAGTGLGVVALVISLLFSLYGSFQRREVLVVTLDAIAGAPPSGVTLLENSRALDMPEQLLHTLQDWRAWSAEVLESHLAYPILSYFRSSHDNESWVSALGAVLDACVLLMTTVEGGPKGPAKLTYLVGGHLVEDLTQYFFGFAHGSSVGVERFEFDQARERLAAAGYRLREGDAAWAEFSTLRSIYATPLNTMARHWAIPPAQWIGDRSYLTHGSTRPAHV